MSELPPALAEVVDDFAAVPARDRLQLLLELGNELPHLPERYVAAHEAMEQVHECQSPLFLKVEVDGSADQGKRVRLFFDAPKEAPTTRGFAGILHAGLDGEAPETVLAVPDDFYLRLGLAELVSPLRLRGMAAMLARVKGQLRAAA
ncbi:SufE family protein [Motilibacter aurantiacus]|uniref:SufE family protein n=1 Tax=Motilibacter aurantiacus TaxID=2714955 RepID=UPI002F2B8DA9